jgi:PAP2 superfamily/Vanadium chloroperoxidase N-terminal domain
MGIKSLGLLAAIVLTGVLTGCGVESNTDSNVSDPSESVETSELQVARVAAADAILFWHERALDANAVDHTPPAAGESRIAGEQGGPPKSTRALAIVQLAVNDAVQSISGRFATYSNMEVNSRADMSAAVAVAAHDTLVALYPSQTATFDAALNAELAKNRSRFLEAGMQRGALAAKSILKLRAGDGSQLGEPTYAELNLPKAPGVWSPDTLSNFPIAFGGNWPKVKPFTMSAAKQFRAEPPHKVGSPEYIADFNDVKQLGGDVNTPNERTADQTIVGGYWGYNGPAKIGAANRLYSQIVVTIAKDKGLRKQPAELSRVLALANVAMADAAIAAWDSKFFYNVWRPGNAIRNTPVAQGGDPNWRPLGAAKTNSMDPSWTLPFPSYPSGHSTIGTAALQVVRRVFGDTSFSFTSDEYNGISTDLGVVRPRTPRFFSGLDAAILENTRSRVYIGLHWRNDGAAGMKMGTQVADQVVNNFLVRR